ncbi:MAG: hypothetical protein IT285_15820 [Bdellovibrionales bacterium]|nr:hypothetical protein [Bdellovibrionales bacterium]
MKTRALLLATAGIGVVLGIGVGLLTRPASRPESAETSPQASGDSLETSAAGATLPSDSPESPAAALGAEGWKAADAPPADARLAAFDPSLLPAREKELQAQLQSAAVPPESLENVAEIARRSADPKTRSLALEALADSEHPKGQTLMTQLYRDERLNPDDREEILGLLRPANSDDDAAKLLIDEVSNERAPEAVKVQALAPLVVMSLLDTSEGPDPRLLGKLPADARKRFMSMYQAMLSGEEPEGIPHSDDNE